MVVPEGVIHVLKNPRNVALVQIKHQTDFYLGEDDKVCFEDQYGRV